MHSARGRGVLQKAIENRDALDVLDSWRAMQRAVRNLGREGLAATAISAVDVALTGCQSEAPKAPSGDASWPLSGCRADLRERWVHHLHRRGTPRAAPRLGGRGPLPMGQDEGRLRPFARSASSGGGSRGDWRSRPVCRCQWCRIRSSKRLDWRTSLPNIRCSWF